MRVIYMGKDKESVVKGLEYLIEKGADIVALVAPPEEITISGKHNLVDAASSYGVPIIAYEDLYSLTDEHNRTKALSSITIDIDLIVSFLFSKRIKKPLIELPRIGCINLHPAPLPDFRGLGGYNIAIYEELPTWGVSAHFVDENFDTGDLIKVVKFPINPKDETALSLEQKSQQYLLDLFKDVVDIVLAAGKLPRKPQGGGRYISKTEYESLKRISPNDSMETIDKKIRAFWFPPYIGAFMEIDNTKYSLINEDILREIASKYRQ